MSLLWSLFKRFEQFLISSAEKSDTKRFLKLNADNRYYRINLNEIRECISTGKEYCSAMGAFFIIEPYLNGGKYRYKIGRYSGEHDKTRLLLRMKAFIFLLKQTSVGAKSMRKDFSCGLKRISLFILKISGLSATAIDHGQAFWDNN